MKVLIFGATGMLGHKLAQRLSREHETWSAIRRDFSEVEKFGIFRPETTISQINVTNETHVFELLNKYRPDVVINTAGIIKQRMTSEAEVIAVNAAFPRVLAAMASDFGYRLISISTDCVFTGRRGNYSEKDAPDADDLYGQSKHLGEVSGANCLTIRTSLIGRELFHSTGLLEWFLANRNKQVAGYTNAIFSGFPTVVFADIISEIISNYPKISGLLHIASKPISKFALLQLINTEYECGADILPATEPRIDRSLDSTKFFQITGYPQLEWGEMIRRMHDDPTPYDSWK